MDMTRVFTEFPVMSRLRRAAILTLSDTPHVDKEWRIQNQPKEVQF